MDRIVLIPSIILGVVVLVAHLVRCYRRGQPFRHELVVSSVLQASGVVVGPMLAASAVWPNVAHHLKETELYTVIAGIAVFAVSAGGIRADWKQTPDEPQQDNPAKESQPIRSGTDSTQSANSVRR